MLTSRDVQWSSATDEAGWIAAGTEPFGQGTVGSIIPGGFEACARLLHPVYADDGERVVRWAQVAAWSGAALTTDVQFHDIALPRDDPSDSAPWQGGGPGEGTLDEGEARRLVAILEAHTITPTPCWFALWDGHGWDSAARYELAFDESDDSDEPGEVMPALVDPVPAEVRAGPRAELPDREYLLYTGPVEAALAFTGEYEQTPNLWWPADRSWCVASDLDLPWTYVAGSASLIEQILSDPGLEALPARPEDTVLLRLTGWLIGAVEAAATELLEIGSAQIRTAHGTVDARLRRPRRWRRGLLQIDCTARSGSDAGRSGPFRARRGTTTRDALRDELTWAVKSLADL